MLLRGDARASSLDPARENPDEDKVLELVQSLYDDDPVLGPALAAALESREMLEVEPMERRNRRGQEVSRVASVAAQLLRGTPTLDSRGGWTRAWAGSARAWPPSRRSWETPGPEPPCWS